MGVDRVKLQEKIQFIRESLEKLRSLRGCSKEAFLGDFRNVDAATRRLQTIIEAMIDIGNHIVAREALGVPRKYQDIFSMLVEGGVIPAHELPIYVDMVKFRNRAVHLYDRIDGEQIYHILQDRLGDVERFVRQVLERYLMDR